jgi:hypothetical protein
MADEEHLSILRQGVEAWNAWRHENRGIWPDLSGYANHREINLSLVDLSGVNLRLADFNLAEVGGANLSFADLRKANLQHANLRKANLIFAKLGEADLHLADLSETNLRSADFSRANLSGAKLYQADLSKADLSRADVSFADLCLANLSEARLKETIFANVNLNGCEGLESCVHYEPSTIDHRTLRRSGSLSLAFLRGVGLPDRLIEYLPSILEQAIQLYSCFISYSSKDQAFAERLYADLQNKGVRCWFAPEDMKIGTRIDDTIDAAIRLRDKLLLILSETSVTSAWVLKEVRTALMEEGRHGRTVLFPIRLDDAVMDTTEQWAHDIRRTRHIGDFTRWKEHDAYQKALDRLLRNLRIEKS